MASIRYGKNKDNMLTALIRINVETDNARKQISKLIKNTDNLTESKFKKQVEYLAFEFEEEVKSKAEDNELEHVRILTFPELADEFIENIRKNYSITYLDRVLFAVNLFNKYLKENGLYNKSINEITVRDVQLFLNSFKTFKCVNGKTATLRKKLPKRVNFAEVYRQGIIRKTAGGELNRGSAIKLSKAQAICDLYNLNLNDYFKITNDVRPYSEETIKGYRRTLRVIFNEALRYDWIIKNPVCNTKVGGTKGNKTLIPIQEKEVFSIAEAKEFIHILDSQKERYINRTIPLKLMLYTGLRNGEIHGLKWEDIDMENQIIHVRRNRLYNRMVGVYEKDPKTKTSNRDIPYPASLNKDLEKLKDWFRLADKDFDNKQDLYYFVSNDYREPAAVASLREFLRSLERREKIKEVSPHGLRHTYCSLLLTQNVPIQTVSKYMGHSDSTITLQVYSHFIPDTREKALIALNIISDNDE